MNWSHVATVYDWQLPLQRRALATAIDLVKPRPDDVLLDVGTGERTIGNRQLARVPELEAAGLAVAADVATVAACAPSGVAQRRSAPRYRFAVAETRAGGDESTADEAPKPTRKQRREHKRRVHEAQKKARAIDKDNDRRARSGERKDQKDMDKAAKKAEKGKQDKADKKTDKVRRRQAKRR